MPALKVETIESEKPILFIVGETNPLISKLVADYKSNFKIALVSSLKTREPSSDLYTIDPTNAALIKNLKEKIDYAIIFLEDQKVKDFVGPVFEKLAADKTKTVVICPIEKVEEFTDVSNAIKTVSHFYFLLEGDIYSEEPNFNPDSETFRLINDALFKKELTLLGNDLKPIFPIYVEDSQTIISQLLLGPVRKNHFYYFFYKSPNTYISAVHILQRVEPDLKIIYKDEGAERYENFEKLEEELEQKLGEKPKFLDEHLEGFEKNLKNFSERGPIKKPPEPKLAWIEKSAKKQNKNFKFLFAAAIFAIVLFIIIEASAATSSFFFLKNAASSFKKGELSNAIQDAKSAKAFYELSAPAGQIAAVSAKNLGQENLNSNYQTFTNAVNLADIAANDASILSKSQTGISINELGKATADALYLYFHLQKLKSEGLNSALKNVSTGDLSKILSIAQVAPEVLGYTGEKHYLLLFQNNGELRPTGGFIGSIGDLTLENGKIKKLDLQDVYQGDGQLKVHVEPYYIVRRYLQPHLYLRDSNFNPDFQDSASASALLYNLETGKKVDGVIAVNFEAVRQLIGAIGPIRLSSYNKTLDANNSFDFLQNTIDNNFFPGSTQKKDVLSSLFDKIMLTISDKDKFIKAVSLIPKLSDQKNILFAFSNNDVQNIFSALNLGGEYKDDRTIEGGKINDFLGINEANIGVNKANINVKRSTSYSAIMSGKKIVSRISHILDNQGKDGYKVFIRFIVPLGSNLKTVKIDGKNQQVIPAITDPKVYEKHGFVAPDGLEVNTETIDGKTVFGFIVNVNPKTSSTIEVEYENGASVPTSSLINYSLLFIKQAGTQAFPFTFDLVYGPGFSSRNAKGASFENGSVVFNKSVDSDQEFDGELLRK